MKIGRKATAKVKRETLVKELHEIFHKVRGRQIDGDSFDKGTRMAELHILCLIEKRPQDTSFFQSALFDWNRELSEQVKSNKIALFIKGSKPSRLAKLKG